MVMARTEAMKGMVVLEEAAIGMQVVEGQQGRKDEAIGIEPVLMNALAGETALLPLIVTNLEVCLLYKF